MKVEIDICDLSGMLQDKVMCSEDKVESKVWMDCYNLVTDYLYEKYKEQTGTDLTRLDKMFFNASSLKPVELDLPLSTPVGDMEGMFSGVACLEED